jgi:lysophospholipase L1-like esterase
MGSVLEQITRRLAAEQHTRIVFYGSSNTERRIHGLHWSDWLDLGLKRTYGRWHRSINSGVGGDTTRDLLVRFEQDVALYQPHVVFVTIGGNDSMPNRGISPKEFGRSLRLVTEKIQSLGAVAVLQTYYSADTDALPAGCRFAELMQIVCDVGAEAGAALIDHLTRWEPVRLQHPQQFHELMLDALHVNSLGNMVLGLDLIRRFGANLVEPELSFCAEGIRVQRLMDKVATC